MRGKTLTEPRPKQANTNDNGAVHSHISYSISHIQTNFKLVKSLLADIEIKREQVKINGVNDKYYIFNKNNIEEMLKHMELNKDVIEYDSDEFE